MNFWPGYSTFQQSQAPQITFVLHDAGETKALAPVMRALDTYRVNYSILADSTAKSLLIGNPHVVLLPQEINALSKVNPLSAAWAHIKLNQALNSTVTIVGLASEFQKNWAHFFQKLGKRVIGYYDGFNYNLRQNRADAFKGCLSELITPSRDTASFFRQRFANIPVIALGQPVLDREIDLPTQSQTQWLKQQFGINPQKVTALFVGGYGPGYAEAFSLFCETVKRQGNLNALVSVHPKTDGELERQIIRRYGLENSIRLIPKAIDTLQVLPLSDLVMAQQSTMAIQALLQGKKVALLGQVGTTFQNDEFNPITHYKLAPRCTTLNEINAWLQWAMPQQVQSARFNSSINSAKLTNLYQLLGIPQQATRNIVQFLLTKLPSNQASAKLA